MSTVKHRSQRISIDLPSEESQIWVHTVMQRVLKDCDYNTTQLVDRVAFVNRSIDQFAVNMVTVTDPVTQQPITVSGAGIAALVKTLIIQWMQEDYGGTVNEYGDLVGDSVDDKGNLVNE